MNNYFEMYSKKEKQIVKVYSITPIDKNDSRATIFVPSLFNVNNQSGWKTVNVTTLIPIECMDTYLKQLPNSKTQRNKAKQRMVLVDAIWRTTDGEEFPHTMIDMAVEHELELMEKEKTECTVDMQ